MSRTFRRKNYENVQSGKYCGSRGSKVNGYYTTWDKYGHHPMGKNGHNGYPIYRAMTKSEKDEEYWRIHGESKHSNAWGPNWYYRKIEKAQFKTFNDREMHRVFKNIEDYECMALGCARKSLLWAYW